MFRDVFTNKWILGGIIFVIVITVGCVLWYQHELAPYRRMAAETAEMLQQSERPKKVSDTHSKTEQAASQTSDESETTQIDAPAQNAEAEVRVSKFGFGPYPELPPDFPWQDLFDYPYYTENPNHPYKDDLDYELMHRVRVELWKRGERGVVGMGTLESTGLFYPTIRGTVYVEWAPRWKVFGVEVGRRIRYIEGHPDDMAAIRASRRGDRPLLESDIPSDIKVLDLSEGIDAYEFLNLSKP